MTEFETKEDLVALLNTSVEEFNQYRQDTNYKSIDLSESCFIEVDLNGADLSFAILSGVDLSGQI